jgi:hypothetical protein
MPGKTTRRRNQRTARTCKAKRIAKTRKGGRLLKWMFPDYEGKNLYLENFFRCYKAKIYSYRCKFIKQYGNKGFRIVGKYNKLLVRSMMYELIMKNLQNSSIIDKIDMSKGNDRLTINPQQCLKFFRFITNQIYVITEKDGNQYHQKIWLKSDYNQNYAWYQRYYNKVVKTLYNYLTDEDKFYYLLIILYGITVSHLDGRKPFLYDPQIIERVIDSIFPGIVHKFPIEDNQYKNKYIIDDFNARDYSMTNQIEILKEYALGNPTGRFQRKIKKFQRKLQDLKEESSQKNIEIIPYVRPDFFPEFSIEIDEIMFTLIGKKLDIEYPLVAIVGHHVSPEYHGKRFSIFWIYPSHSELGMWRLAGNNESNEFNKLTGYEQEARDYPGYQYITGDYVQTTFVHLSLQTFVNDSFHKLTEIPGDNLTNMLEYINDKLNNVYPTINKSNLIIPYDSTVNINHLSTHPDRFLTDEEKEFHLLSPIIRAIHNRSNVTYPYPFVFMSGIRYRQYVYSTEVFNLQCGESKDQEELNRFSEILSEIYEPGPFYEVADKVNTFEKVINATGKIYRVLLTKKPVIDSKYLTFTIKWGNKGRKDLQVNPETDILPEVVLYFLEASMQPSEECLALSSNKNMREKMLPIKRICKKEKHYMPFFLTVPDAKVNLFGIYDKYINSGNYICKLFDYKKQCSEDENLWMSCGNTYSYIGARYDNLFPYNIMNNRSKKEKSNRLERITQSMVLSSQLPSPFQLVTRDLEQE